MKALAVILRRELHLAFRGGGDSATTVLFFVLAAILFPFGIGPEASVLTRIGAGVIWVVALLAAMLSLERLFSADYEDGTLELLALTPLPLELVVLTKMAAHWLTTGLPLIIATPLLALLYGLPLRALPILLLTMLIGTPTLSLMGSIGAALTLGARRGGVLLSLLVLPLYIPVLIFGVGAIDAAVADLPVRPHLLILGSLLAASLPLCPWAAAAALRQALD
ncbi:MAG: heme exporter protein CcmB [Alphaproteobacteria bacterium]